MAVLDLQGMEAAPQTAAGGSSGSGHSCGSTLSAAACGGGSSMLSIAVCGHYDRRAVAPGDWRSSGATIP